MDRHRTEQVYDDEMSPLIVQLIEISKREGIPLLIHTAMFLPDGDSGEFIVGGCVTRVPGTGSCAPEFHGMVNRHGLCSQIVQGDERFDRAAGMVISRFHAP